MKPEILQTYPLTPEMEAELGSRFIVHRWFEIDDRDGFLARSAQSIRAVVTGGHLGISPQLATALPDLEIVAVNGVGFDKVDLDLARSQGVQGNEHTRRANRGRRRSRDRFDHRPGASASRRRSLHPHRLLVVR